MCVCVSVIVCVWKVAMDKAIINTRAPGEFWGNVTAVLTSAAMLRGLPQEDATVRYQYDHTAAGI